MSHDQVLWVTGDDCGFNRSFEVSGFGRVVPVFFQSIWGQDRDCLSRIIMNLSQKKFSNRTNFKFGDDSLEYTVKDKSGSHTFSVEYGAIASGSGEIEERNAWYRNVGFFWILIGAFVILSRYTDTGEIRGSMWLTLGIICFALYWSLKTTYTTLDSEKGRILIIKDSSHDEIKETIETRRKEQWFRWYGTIDYGNDPEKEIGKFRWLLDRDAISEERFLDCRSQILDHHGRNLTEALVGERTIN